MAAPMPRFGSVWLDPVCLVPKPARVVMMVWIRFGSISRTAARRSWWSSGRALAAARLLTVDARASVALEMIGAAIAEAAPADRNSRRLGAWGRETSFLSMSKILGQSLQKSSYRLLAKIGQATCPPLQLHGLAVACRELGQLALAKAQWKILRRKRYRRLKSVSRYRMAGKPANPGPRPACRVLAGRSAWAWDPGTPEQ